MNEILKILENNARLTAEQIAVMINKDEAYVAAALEKLEADRVILGYKTLIDWEKTKADVVTAFIELRVTPQMGEGFDNIAQRIYRFDKVESVYLMSGSFDIGLIIKGKSMKEVALFVAEKLAPMDSVVSTSTHFVLKKYKDGGVIFDNSVHDERSVIST